MSDLATHASRRLMLWLSAIRPRTLTIALAPIIVGVAHAHADFGRVAWLPVAAATLAAVLIQIATNLFNDAADGERGGDGPEHLGPLRVTGAHLMSASEVRRGALGAAMLAALFGLGATLSGGWPILLIGIAALCCAYAYSEGPRPIAMTPLGEVFVIAFFGVAAVAGTAWLAAGAVNGQTLLLGLATGLPAGAVLTVNNHRDRVADARQGRRTLAIRLGPTLTAYFYTLELLLALMLAMLVVPGLLAKALLLPLAALALVFGHRMANAPIDSSLNRLLAQTAQWQLALALLVAVLMVRS